MKKIIVVLFILMLNFSSLSSLGMHFVHAADFEIIPESEVDDSTVGGAVESVGKAKDGVWKEYNSQASSLPIGGQFASGIMNWDTILDYAVYLVKFLFELGLFVGAIMIVYAGYIYAMGVFGLSGKGTSEGTTAIKLAIGGSLVVLFSFAIIKILTSIFL